MQHAVKPFEAHRDDWYIEARCHHTNAGLESLDFTAFSPRSFGKDQDDRPALTSSPM